MPLGYEFTLQSDSIARAKRLKAEKVVLLDGFNGDDVVVKMDPKGWAGSGPVKSSNTVMKAIDPSAKIKVLTDGELQQLGNWVAQQKSMFQAVMSGTLRLGRGGRAHSLEEHYPALHDLDYMVTQAAIDQHLMKMPKVAVMDLKDALSERDAKGETADDPLNRFKAALMADGGLERLGEIIAADLFVSNGDRFHPRNALPQFLNHQKPNERKICFKTIVNLGNVFLSLDTEREQLSGLDYVDPNGSSTWGNWVRLAQTESAVQDRWPGRLLANPGERQKFAKAVIADLDWIFTGCRTPKPTSLVVFQHEGVGELERLEKGMISGCQKICAMLKNKEKSYRKTHRKDLAKGMMDRYEVLKKVK